MLPRVLQRLCRHSGALAVLFALCAVNGSADAQFISTPGTLYRIAGGAAKGSNDGLGPDAQFNEPEGLIKFGDSLLVVDRNNHAIRQILSNGYVAPFAGRTGICGRSDGTGTYSLFCNPMGIAADATGNLFVTENYFNAIRRVSRVPLGQITTLAGGSGGCETRDGTGVAAQLCDPRGIAADSAGNLYVADTSIGTIRKVTPAGIVTNLAGGLTASVLVPNCGYKDDRGTAARFCLPTGMAIDAAGNLYVADTFNSVIRKITLSGVVSTVAGIRGCGNVDGPGSVAEFCLPIAIAFDAAGNLYVADHGNSTIRKITNPGGPAGTVVVSTVAGTHCAFGSQPCPTIPGRLPGSIGRPTGLVVIGPNQLAITTQNDEVLGINF